MIFTLQCQDESPDTNLIHLFAKQADLSMYFQTSEMVSDVPTALKWQTCATGKDMRPRLR